MGIELSKIRDHAINKFNFLKKKKTHCPAISKDIRFTNEGFSHMSFKNKKHIREAQEQCMRFLCFFSVDTILKKSFLFQEHRSSEEEIEIKREGEKIKEIRNVDYYGFVGIVESRGKMHRIRVVIRHVNGFEKADFHSVMPAWKMEGYKNFSGPID